jgi:DNA-binding response OmpR family regulator
LGDNRAIVASIFPEKRQRRILVVEDDDQIRQLVETLLGSAGYAVTTTGRPSEALALARRESPHLILCDIAMPELDGYGVLRALQSDPETACMPVVFLTAHREFSERVRAFRFGVVDYVTKPFTKDILIRKVEKVLEGLHHRPGIEGGAGPGVESLLEDVKREGRSGVLTVRGAFGESRAVIQGGEIVEGTLPPADESLEAHFQELDHDREAIVAHDPPRLPGSASALEELQSLPDVLRTVLVVDDNQIFRTFLRDVLTRRNFTVYEAEDGEKALAVALEKRPWLILTDVSMPGVDGLEFCRRVRSQSLIRHTPLIFLSGWDDYKDRYRGLEAGADEYLSKETPVRELMIRIQLVLKRYSDIGARAWRGPGMEGRVEIIGIPGLLQMCHLGRLTGVLSVGSGGRPAVVRFRDGEILSAAAGGPTGAEAVYELLSWTEGSFTFAPAEALEGETLEPRLAELLLEGCRRLDERERTKAVVDGPN